VSYLFYGRPSKVPAELATRFKPAYLASLNKFYVDEIYAKIIIGPLNFFAAAAEFFDIVVIDNLVRLVAWIPRLFGRYVLGPFQNGLVQYYAAVTAFSVAGLLFVFLWLSLS
jgi:NADH-quinone oxidoreductase subunit L